MFTVYIYVLDTLADWELGYVTAELNSGRFSKRTRPKYQSKQLAYLNGAGQNNGRSDDRSRFRHDPRNSQ